MRRFMVLVLVLGAMACRDGDGDALGGLERAAARGEVLLLRQLLEDGAFPDQIGASGFTALATAVRYGRLGVVDVLAQAGADLDLPCGGNDWTPLQHAIHKNQRAAVDRLVRLGADVNRGTASGFTPLMMAAGYGQAATVELLLEHGADPAVVSSRGHSALTLAVTGVPDLDAFTLGRCQTRTVRVLLEHDARLRAQVERVSPLGRLYVRMRCRDVARLLGGG